MDVDDRTRYKYPRTLHLPWSPGVSGDDSVLLDTSLFRDKEIVITEKMDGENTTIYWDGFCHARSIDSGDHPSRHRAKALAASLVGQLPKGWRVCGENLTAVHSIEYESLSSWFQVFAIFNDKNYAISWEETKEQAALLGLETVPVMIEPVLWHESSCRGIYPSDAIEGYVVRLTSRYAFEYHAESTAKYVRANHVQTDDHWLKGQMKLNGWK